MRIVEKALAVVESHIADKDILEAACGTGDFSAAASKLAKSVKCIDLVDSRLGFRPGEIENLSFELGDVSMLNFPDASFDSVVMYNSLWHIKDVIEPAIDEFLRVVKPGGSVTIISTWRLDDAAIENFLLTCLNKKDIAYDHFKRSAISFVIIQTACP